MPGEDRPGGTDSQEVENWFKEARESQQRGTLRHVLQELPPEIRDKVILEALQRYIKTLKLSQEEAVNLALDINKKLGIHQIKDVIVGSLRRRISAEVSKVLLDVVAELTDENLLPPGFFSQPQRAARFSREAQGERQQRETDYSVEVHFTENAYDVINELMNRSRTAGSLSAVLTQALAFEKWYRDAVAANHRVLIERGRGKFREVKRP